MADELLALYPPLDQPVSASLDESDYAAVQNALAATERGRWFLSEYARRSRPADARLLLTAIERIETVFDGERSIDVLRREIAGMANAIAELKAEIAAAKPPSPRPDAALLHEIISLVRDLGARVDAVADGARRSASRERLSPLEGPRAAAPAPSCAPASEGPAPAPPRFGATSDASLGTAIRPADCVTACDRAESARAGRALTPLPTSPRAAADRPTADLLRDLVIFDLSVRPPPPPEPTAGADRGVAPSVEAASEPAHASAETVATADSAAPAEAEAAGSPTVPPAGMSAAGSMPYESQSPPADGGDPPPAVEADDTGVTADDPRLSSSGDDPLAPLLALSEEEVLALFS